MKTVITTLLLGLIISSGLQAQTIIQDTLLYDTTYDDTLNLKPYEAALCVYKIPADGVIKGFNVPIAAIDYGLDSSIIRVEIYSLNYPYDSTGNQYSTNYVDENGWLGYHPYPTNDTIPEYSPTLGPDWNAFGDTGLCAGTELIPHTQDPLNLSIWIGDFAPYYIWTTGDHWMDFEDHGYIDQVQKDEYVGILLYHYLPNGMYEDTTPVVSFHSNNATEISNPYPLLVFSPSCRGISGEGGWHIRSAVINCVLAIEYESVSTVADPQLPASFAMRSNYPNPFNPTTTIQYELPRRSVVQITIHDLLGREVTTLMNQTQEAGFKSIIWDATNNHDKPVSAGVYLYQIRAGEFVQTKKMVLLK